MSLADLVVEAGRALGQARDLYGQTPQSARWSSTVALSAGRQDVVQTGQQAAQGWQGEAAEDYGAANQRGVSALDSTITADGGTGPPLNEAGQAATEGGQAMDGVISDTQSGVSAIAPATGTGAGKMALVTHLQGELNRAKSLLALSRQRDALLSQMITASSRGYTMPPQGTSSPMAGLGGGGSPMMPSAGSGFSLPQLGGLGSLAHDISQQHQPALAQLPSGAPTDNSAAGVAVRKALSVLGTPYVWGGKNPSTGLDCSGLTHWAYGEAGVTLGSDTYSQIHDGHPVSPGDVRPGDLIFSEFDSHGPGHVQLALDNGQVVQAPQPGDVVKISPLPSSFVARRIVG